MRRRAEQVDQTRQRIIEAAVKLHTTIGPAHTTISALAEEAGVTRLTVYRHFSDEEELFTACQAHWLHEHPPPDPEGWLRFTDFRDRARGAFDELYGWYLGNGDDLYPIHRQLEAMPEPVQAVLQAAERAFADALVQGVPVRGRAKRRLRAAAGHVVSFWTWWSLAVEQGLSHREAVRMAILFLEAVADEQG